MTGHFARECPSKGKGKGEGKGKGQGKGDCYHCGKAGHYARDCWSKGKGKGRSAVTLNDCMQELTDWWNTEGEEDWSWNYQAEEIQGQEGQAGQGLARGSLEGKDAGLSLGG